MWKVLITVLVMWAICNRAAKAGEAWRLISSRTGDLPLPNAGDQQTCLVPGDFDDDGRIDFVVGERTQVPSIVLFRNTNKEWQRVVIDDSHLRPEAGGVAFDVDRDGDLDLILGQDASGSEMWWWENPFPKLDGPWVRRTIKKTGGRKHHDQTIGDFDGDSHAELVSWNQGARQLLLFEIPENVQAASEWPRKEIFRWTAGAEYEGFPSQPVDVDNDGLIDIVGGGAWFKYGNGEFVPHTIDDSMRFTQCAAGQLVPGGFAEVVFSPGDADGDAKWYEWNGKRWQVHMLGAVRHGHTCEIADLNLDGHLDIMIGEMGSPGAGDDARIIVWWGDGKGNFRDEVIYRGQGIHEGRLADVDGDCDLDILVKPYHHHAPFMGILINPTK
ncbi:VCBS repeat-containing protein [Thermogutta sp.]|uniref:FG-GAP repeat domain-containing protein n=1 Tax=Thermogutta sp. TaxID=1962930 RepID=UPI003220475C